MKFLIILSLIHIQMCIRDSKSIVKANPHEKVGVFCKRNGKPNVIEYSEITDEMAVLRVKREEEFAPVKNSDSAGVDCPRTARELYKNFYKL